MVSLPFSTKFLIVLLFGLALFLSGCLGPSNNPKVDAFAQCLTQQGAKMYGAWWCPHCQNQKELFGSSWQFVTAIECSTPDGRGQLPVCQQAGIRGYPTWVFADGSRESRELTFDQLAQKTGCPKP